MEVVISFQILGEQINLPGQKALTHNTNVIHRAFVQVFL